MPKYTEEIDAYNPFTDESEMIDIEYETALSWGTKKIFDITDLKLTSKTVVPLDGKIFKSEYLEDIEERVLDRAKIIHGDD